MIEEIDSTIASKQEFRDYLVQKYNGIDVNRALDIVLIELEKVELTNPEDEKLITFVKALHSQLNQTIIISIIEKYINSYKHMTH